MLQNLIPINVITGFLGSGKTTLLSQILKNKKLKNTAVIINEFGKIGLDHNLISHNDENVIELQDGCICCSIQNDLRLTLINLYKKMDNKNINDFNRVVIETTGLADPLSISDTLLNCPELQKIYKLESLITVVDGINGENTLKYQKESIRQVYLASSVILSKVDLATKTELKSLYETLKKIKPNISLFKSIYGKVPISLIFPNKAYNVKNTTWKLKKMLKEETNDDFNIDNHKNHPHDHNVHGNDIYSFAMKRNTPINKKTFNFFIETLEQEMGPYLLRVKGILNILGENRPAVIHGAQNILHPIEWLDAWPDKDKTTRIVFITSHINQNTFKGFCTSILGLEEILN